MPSGSRRLLSASTISTRTSIGSASGKKGPRITDISGDPGRAGSTYISRRGRFGSRFELMTAERPASQVVEFDGPMGLRAEMSSQFAPEEGGTKLTISLIARWRFPLLGRILELAIFNPRIAKRELGRLKALAEREER